MRSLIRGARTALIAAGAFALAACQQEAAQSPEAPRAPTNAEREAEVAAAQLAALGAAPAQSSARNSSAPALAKTEG